MSDTPTTPLTMTDASVRSVTKALRDFGYTSLTEEEVRATGNRLLAGESADGDIIAMFMRTMFRDAGLLTEDDR